jgi:ubiquitin-protein ligase
MSIQRIRAEVSQAANHFVYVEAHPTTDGSVYVKAALQTSLGHTYFLSIFFADYPSRMPQIYVTNPTLQSSPHQYNNGTICYMHPNMWNPGQHGLTFVLARAAKWLNKYDIYLEKRYWPGAEVPH